MIATYYRPDVIEDRKRFINEYRDLYENAVKVDPITFELMDTDKPFILKSQDEKIHHR